MPSRATQAGSAGVHLSAHMTSKVRPFESNNVVAMLPGSDDN